VRDRFTAKKRDSDPVLSSGDITRLGIKAVEGVEGTRKRSFLGKKGRNILRGKKKKRSSEGKNT